MHTNIDIDENLLREAMGTGRPKDEEGYRQ